MEYSDELLRDFILDLRAIRFAIELNCIDDDLQIVQQYLERQLTILSQMHDHPEAFSSNAVRVDFFRRAAHEMRGIEKHNIAWQKFEQNLQSYDWTTKEQDAVAQYFRVLECNAPTWAAMCLNKAPYTRNVDAKKQMLAQLGKGDKVTLSLDVLPYGGVLILERWRREVDSVIGPNLLVSSALVSDVWRGVADFIMQAVDPNTGTSKIEKQRVRSVRRALSRADYSRFC